MPGTHQHGSAEGVALVHSLYGTHVGGTQGINDSNPDVQPAGLHSTLPYRPPKRRQRDNPEKLLCSAEDCKAFPMKSTGYCAGHSRSLGLVEWDKGGRPKEAKPDVDDR
jgi:hypothetical protein